MGLRSECSSVGKTVTFVVLFHCDDSFCRVRGSVKDAFSLNCWSLIRCHLVPQALGKWQIPSGVADRSNNGVIAADGGH